ncbi:MAG: cardiolipin synthase [Lachnospiraceae bacterium]
MRLLTGVSYKKMIANRIIVTGFLIIVQFVLMVSLFYFVIGYSWFILSIFYILSGLYSVYLVSKDDSPTYKIGWLIVIMLFPPFGTFLYMLWGDKKPSKKLQNKMKKSYAMMDEYLPQKSVELEELLRVDKRAGATANYIRGTTRYPLYKNTSVAYYPLGEDMFADILVEMKKAKHYIFLEYYIIDEGEMWGKMLEVLLQKAKEGVEIRIIYDDLGTVALLPRGYNKALEEMDPHIKCLPFNPIVPFLAMVMNNRDHRKILVIDGNVGFTGGINLADEYINQKERFGHWKDNGVMLKGEAVFNFTAMFLELWNACHKEKMDPVCYKPKFIEEVQAKGFVLPYGDDPLDWETVGENVYMDMINQAQDYIYITTPYLILDDQMKNALCIAAKRGVDIRIITPGIADKKMVFRLTRSNYKPLLAAGVNIYEYTPGFIHAKTIVCDDKMGVVGTINFDYRSLFLHFECGVWLYAVEAIYDVRDDILETLKISKKVTLQDQKKTKIGNFIDGLLRIMAPLM